MIASPAARNEALPARPSSLAQLLAYFLKLGTIGFGGPIALAEHMESGLALSELAPGPLTAQRRPVSSAY